eukprot:TRINITY_DN67436_c4_g4_i2.p1 TRINITY_DN67436_c4_g4~~TRINITY_DN67436_c4_g4_i2.p1  ORF type:complete len:167 (-),score=15.63 TRINITY_DN67436_c4_g4_i2:104-577(-)
MPLAEVHQDELEGLLGIYGDELREKQSQFVAEVQLANDTKNRTVSFIFEFVDGYPEERGPQFNLHASWLNGSQIGQLETEIRSQAQDMLGSPMIYNLVEWLRNEGMEALEGTWDASSSSTTTASSIPAPQPTISVDLSRHAIDVFFFFGDPRTSGNP